MKTKLHVFFLLLFFCSFTSKALATNYYTASATATLAGNAGAVNANWTTNPDGLTGLTTVAIAAGDNLILLNGGIATITATTAMSITALTINQGGKIIHNNNATGASFSITGLLTWNGTIKTLQGVSGSNFFSVSGDVVGTTAIYDTGSNRGVYLGGDGLRTINLTQLASSTVTSGNISVGLQLGKNRTLTGNCKIYSPLVYSGNCTLDLAGYNLQISSIKGGTTARLIKGNANSNLTISANTVSTGSHATTIYFDPTATAINSLNVNSEFLSTAAGNVIIGGDLTLNSLNFGTTTGDKATRILQVNGNFTLNNNGNIRVQAKGITTPGTDYDQLNVTGSTNIGTSTTLKVDFTNSYTPQAGAQFDFVQSTGAVTGNFTTIQTPTGYTASVNYPTGKVQYQVLTLPPPPPQCSYNYNQNADLPLLPSNATIETEINTIYQRFSDSFLGITEPTATALNNAIASYNALGITVNGYNITATVNVTDYDQVATFLKTFAQYLKFHPEDTNNIFTKALNTVWLVSDRICKGTMPIDGNQYSYRNFIKPAILIPAIKDNSYVKSLFENVLYQQDNFGQIWEPNYVGGINIDHFGNSGIATMAYVKWIDSADERFRFMTAFKRKVDNFCSYTPGTYDGIKPDGSGFHHWGSYPSYTYDLSYATDIISSLKQTSFAISSAAYLRYRDALMAQLMFTNDATTRFLTMTGRKPEEVATTISRYDFRNMAVAGGSILGTGKSDPVMATFYNRVWGPINSYTSQFGNSTVAPFNEGYFQFNHSMAGIYRKNGWLAVCKGFNDNMFGTEIFGPASGGTANRYGRYQSYGAVQIIYPGDAVTGNGYDYTTWNWNYNPGTTVIRLPWDKLAAEKDRLDERQQKKFAGSLSFINKNSDYLKAIHGTYGMFAMDFQEATGRGWGTIIYPENHNATFVFKKSVFTFDNMLICLGSNIGNNDAVNNTLTTLYQRKATTGKEDVNADSNLLQGSTYSNSYADTDNHWVVDNFSTGFYVFSGSGTIKLTRTDQQTPQHNKLLTEQTISNNPTGNYAIGYLDHGTAPSNKGYEYICIPQATATDMTTLGSQITSGNKPYTVHRKDNIAHIVEYKPTANSSAFFGYAFFSALSGIDNSGQLTGADYPCLVMSQYDSAQKSLKIAVNNPDLGFEYRAYTPSISKQINIKIKGTNWQIDQPNANASITGIANGETTIQFTTVDGLPVEILLKRDLSPKTIAPVADSYVRSIGYADQNFGTDPTLIIKKDGTSDRNREIYLKFDLNNVNSFDNATLRLNLASAGVNVAGTTWQVYHVPTDNWSETGITWNNKPASSTLLGTANGQSSGWVEWHITNQALAEFSGDKTVSLRLVSTYSNSNADATFRSKEDTNTTLRPQLLFTQNNPPPIVSITSPVSNASFTTPTSVAINVNASDTNGTVTKVEFFQGTTKLGEDLTAPYSFTWDNVAIGQYAITAVATDNEGATATSAVVNVFVNEVLTTVADAYVQDGSATANTNFGTDPKLLIKKDGTNSGRNREIYLKFDLNNITNFDNAILRLNIVSAGVNIAQTTWEVYSVADDSWSETGINWNNKPISSTLLKTIQGKNSGWVEWNITNQVLAELSGDKILSLRLVSTYNNSNADATFRSKEDNTDLTLCPQLQLTSNSSMSRMTNNNLVQKKIQQEEPEVNVTIQAYPNPVKDVLHININENTTGVAETQLFDINGRMLLNQKLTDSNTELNVSRLSSGLYLVKVLIDGKEIKVMKIVKM